MRVGVMRNLFWLNFFIQRGWKPDIDWGYQVSAAVLR